jgi:DNA-binding transcriptional MerR regulator
VSEPERNPEAITVDALAERTGMTVRNLREWRTLGLLPPAELRGRVGYYDPAVVDRIRHIQKLHAEGFTLELIRKMLDAGGEDVMRLAGALRAPFRAADPPAVDLEEWDEAQLARALDLGLVRRGADDRLEFASARAAEIGAALRDIGLSSDQILDATAAIRAHADGMAAVFEDLWREHIWQPYLDSELPPERLGGLLDQLQPLAVDAVLAIFTVAMEARIEQGIARELGRD